MSQGGWKSLNAKFSLSSAAVKIRTPSSAQGFREIQVELVKIREAKRFMFLASRLCSHAGL